MGRHQISGSLFFPFAVRRWTFRALLLLVAVLIVSAAFGLLLSASETTAVQVDEDLAQYWRTTYDILVRPPGYRSDVEEKYGLVRSNALLEISGGISFDQYETIKNLPGVEIAAPVAVLGFWNMSLHVDIYPFYPLPPGVFANVCTIKEDEGVRIHTHTSTQSFASSLFDFTHRPDLLRNEQTIGLGSGLVCSFDYEGLIAAIEPTEEEALVRINQTLSDGNYLQKAPLKPEPLSTILAQSGLSASGIQAILESEPHKEIFPIPLLVNATTYVSLTLSGEAWQLQIPPDAYSVEEILKRGGVQYVSTLPRQSLWARQNVTISKELLFLQIPATSGLPHPEKLVTFSPIRYRLSASPTKVNALAEAIPVDSTGRRFREKVERPIALRLPYKLITQGIFESEKLKYSTEELTAVPMDLYFPPTAILRYDENGVPVEPKVLMPTTNADGYLQPPPLALTTMEAARLLAGDDCISAIRVRVAGVDRFSPEAQSRIEAVAAEIVNRTGLDVDIVVGSSPRPVLVHIPGTGYVEEYWVQKGVSLTTHREVHRANYLLFAAMLSVCALFIFNTTSTTVAGRIQEFGLLKALGWRGSDLTALVLTEGLLIGALGGALGTVLALGLAKALGLVFPLGRALLILPTGILLCLAGFALPALQAGRVSPMVALRQGEQTWRGRVPRWLGVVGRSLLRRRMRSLLVAGVIAAGAGMLALLVSLLVGMRGYLALTLLGRYILVRVSGYHWGMVGVMMAVGALATADVLLAGVLERRREIGVLKTLGWRTGAVARLFLLEGAVLGLLGGLAGTTLGLAVYLGLYRSVGAGLLWAVLAGLGVPTLVGVLAAAYPARVAAGVAPAEAVRGE